MKGGAQKLEVLGKGVYAPADAQRLTGVRSARILRWIRGYDFATAEGRRRSPPIFGGDLQRVDGQEALSFLDLIEVLYVGAFHEAGVSLHAIREASRFGQQLFETSHPFCTRRFRTDGKKMFAKYRDEQGVERLFEVLKSRRGQTVFDKVIEPLFRQLEFDVETSMAIRWWPLGTDRHVVVDPKRSFGAPITRDGNVPTRAVYEAYLAEKDVNRVASWFEIPAVDVEDAIAFETRLRTAA